MMRHICARTIRGRAGRTARTFNNQAQQSATNKQSSRSSDVASLAMYAVLFGGAFCLANSIYHPRLEAWFGQSQPIDKPKRTLKITDHSLSQAESVANERVSSKVSESVNSVHLVTEPVAVTSGPHFHPADVATPPTDAAVETLSSVTEKQSGASIDSTSTAVDEPVAPAALAANTTIITNAVPTISSSTAAPSSSPSTALQPQAETSSSDSDLGEPSDAERAHLDSYFSGIADEHPNKPGLRILTANRIDSVLASPTPFILYVHDPECGACTLYEPVIESLAAVLHDVAPDVVRVYQMNDSTDYKPGFLAADESNLRLPLIKFYPQLDSREPEVYSEAPHVGQIVAFLNTRVPVPIDTAQVKSKLDLSLPDLRAQLRERGIARLAQSNDWALFKASPCGDEISDFTLTELMSNFAPGIESHDAYEKFTKCVKDREDEVITYFTEVARIASETADALQTKRGHTKHSFTPEEEAEIVSAAAAASA